MRIHNDLPISDKVLEIGTNYFGYGLKELPNDRVQITRDFRTHPKFSKRIYFAFKPLWWALHYWDELFADRLIPEWSFGFAVLTVYPDPDPETSTCDGYADYIDGGSGQIWTTIVGLAGNGSGDAGVSGAPFLIRGGGIADEYNRNYRAFTLFDTSAIVDTDVIDSAIYSLYILNDFRNFLSGEDSANSTFVVVETSPASNTALVDADYQQHVQQHGVVMGESQIQANISASGYEDVTLNSAGRDFISKTGITKLGTASRWDLDDTATGLTWVINALQFYLASFADETGTTQDPKLVVTSSAAGYFLTRRRRR